MIAWEAAHALAMSMPDAELGDHFGSPSFRVKGKIYAQLSARGSERPQVLIKLSAADQAALLMSDPDTFSSVPQWGQHGWTYVQLATIEHAMLQGLLVQSWRRVAPKARVAAYDAASK